MQQIRYNNVNNLRVVDVTSGVYRITNTVTGDFYIGSSKNIESRWYNHRWHLKRGSHANEHLQRAWDKYGPDAFTFELIEEVPSDRLLDVEQARLETDLPPYNLSLAANRPTGMRGRKHSAETRAKMSSAQKGRPLSPEALERVRLQGLARRGQPGRKRPPEEIARTALSRVGRKHTPEAIEKMRIASTGRKQTQEAIEKTRQANIGRPRSEETKRKISEAQRGRPGPQHSAETRARMAESQRRRRAAERGETWAS